MNAKEFYDEVTGLIKAIGTTSSANQEADERSVENYVRGNSNTNTNNQIGGNIMSNTTEPDPNGDIAVNKSFPTAGGDKLISQETRPTDGATSVSDAPNNPGVVPNQATIPSDATSAIAPSREGEMNQPEKVTITKSSTCPDCGGSIVHECMGKADNAEEEGKVEKAADSDEVTETVEKAADVESKEEDANETAADEKTEMKKSVWGGQFSPFIK